MTEDEARKIAAIMNHADGGCADCAAQLNQMLVEIVPEHAEAIGAVFEAKFGLELFPDPPPPMTQERREELGRLGWTVLPKADL